jgi:hypothetical protein
MSPGTTALRLPDRPEARTACLPRAADHARRTVEESPHQAGALLYLRALLCGAADARRRPVSLRRRHTSESPTDPR